MLRGGVDDDTVLGGDKSDSLQGRAGDDRLRAGPRLLQRPPGNADDEFEYTLGPDGDTATLRVTVSCTDDLPVGAR